MREPTKVETAAFSRRDYALLCLGYGAFLSYFPIGPIGTAALTQVASNWQTIVVARVLFLLATVTVILMWKAHGHDDFMHRPSLLLGSLAVALVGFAALYAGDVAIPSDLAACVFALLLGIATATPKVGWYEGFFAVYRARGRCACVIAIAACFFVAPLFTPLTYVMGYGRLPAFLCVAAMLVLSWACMALMARSSAFGCADELVRPRRTAFRASVYTRAVVLSFGVAWSFSFNVAAGLGYGGGPAHGSTWSVMLAGIVVCAGIIVLFGRFGSLGKMRFGLLLRWVIVLVGSIWALMPTIVEYAPVFSCFMCSMAYLLQNVVMILFIMEVCEEYGATVCAVTSTHYGAFILAACAGSLLYWLLVEVADSWTAHSLMSAVALIASLSVIPLLPSRGSSAGIFSRDELPEDEGRDERVDRGKRAVVADFDLTAREAEVLDYLVEGYSRNDIASALSVSPWTVKNHVTSIYGKLGVHSVKELMELVEKGPGGVVC